MKKVIKKTVLGCCVVICIGMLCFAGINALVIGTTHSYIVSASDAAALENVDCILVLGCAVWNGNTLSPMLKDRVETGLDLYNSGASERLLMSGDHGHKNYDEVNNMKQYCVDRNIDADVIFLDHAGFSTYESMYRAQKIFGVRKMIVVTQRYHLSRAVYIARSLGIDTYGVPADIQTYTLATRTKNTIRESLARVKDCFMCVLKPEPTYLGEAIPINGSAVLSDDKEYV